MPRKTKSEVTWRASRQHRKICGGKLWVERGRESLADVFDRIESNGGMAIAAKELKHFWKTTSKCRRSHGCAYPSWNGLIEALEPYLRLTGWRYKHQFFMQDDAEASSELQAARRHGKAAVCDWGMKLLSISSSEEQAGAAKLALSQEYIHCKRIIAAKALRQHVKVVCMEQGLWGGYELEDELADGRWEDMTAPLDKIARRLYAFEAELGTCKEYVRATLEAELVVEFAEEHGLPTEEDPHASALRREFMQRVDEWCGRGGWQPPPTTSRQLSVGTRLSRRASQLSMSMVSHPTLVMGMGQLGRKGCEAIARKRRTTVAGPYSGRSSR